MRGGNAWQLPFTEQEPQDVRARTGVWKWPQILWEVHQPSSCPASTSLCAWTSWTFAEDTKSGLVRMTFVSLCQLMKYVLSGDFIFIFSNLDLKRSSQYLIDGHPRVCNKVRTCVMGCGWQDHFLLQKKKCNKRIHKKRRLKSCVAGSGQFCSLRTAKCPAPLLDQASPFPGSLWWSRRVGPWVGGVKLVPQMLIFFSEPIREAERPVAEPGRTGVNPGLTAFAEKWEQNACWAGCTSSWRYRASQAVGS